MNDGASNNKMLIVSVYDPAIVLNYWKANRDYSMAPQIYQGLLFFKAFQHAIDKACRMFGIKACAVLPEISCNHLDGHVIFELRVDWGHPVRSGSNQRIEMGIWIEDLLEELDLSGVINWRIDYYQSNSESIFREYGMEPIYL